MIILTHNLNPKKYQWLWAKYVSDVNLSKHCTNCLKGPYSKTFSAHNSRMVNSDLRLNEAEEITWKAIYICGVIKKGYPKSNYPHNLHTAIIRETGATDTYEFEECKFEVRDGRFVHIPLLSELPFSQRRRDPEFTSCRIFRWAVMFQQQRVL